MLEFLPISNVIREKPIVVFKESWPFHTTLGQSDTSVQSVVPFELAVPYGVPVATISCLV